jgi:hypothetical protein
MEKISDKLYSIVVLLENDDIKRISNQLKAHKNKKLEKLFKIMIDSLEKEISKEQAFKKIYDKEYKKEDDFLLRNECRLVYNLIKEYLIEKEVQNDRDNDELFNDYYFIKAIYQKKDKTIFNKEFYSLLDKSIEYHDFMRASQLCDIGFVATGAQQIQNFQNIKNAVETLEKQQDILGQFYTLKNYVINNRITNMHAILSTKDREQLNLSPRSNIEYDIKKYQNDLISYYKIISASLIESDIPKKIALMESGYGYIEKVAKVNREY